MTRRIILYIVLAVALLGTSSVAAGAVTGLGSTARREIGTIMKRQATVLCDAVDTEWKTLKKSKEDGRVRKTVVYFEKALARGETEKIWSRLISKNARGATAVAMAADGRSEGLTAQRYRAIKGFRAGRAVAMAAFRDGIKRKPGGKQIGAIDVRSSGNKAVALVKYENGGVLPVVLVKQGSAWKIDLATMMSVGKPNLAVSAVVEGDRLLDAGLEESADALLRDASGLEGAFKRAGSRLLGSFFDRESSKGFSAQLDQFKILRTRINGLQPQT